MLVAAFIIAAFVAGGAGGAWDPAAARTVADDVNAHRANVHVAPLAIDPQLTAVARERAADLLRHRYFGHVGPNGATAIDALRDRSVQFSYAGENLAEADTVGVADAALWASPEHRENIVERHYRRIGIAVVNSPDVGTLVVQIFAD